MKVITWEYGNGGRVPFSNLEFRGSFTSAKNVFRALEHARNPDDALEYWHSDDNGGCIVIRLNGEETVVKAGEVATVYH